LLLGKGNGVTDDACSFLVVLDTPSVKQFVFGTDALPEVRGASAILDGLNRQRTEQVLQAQLAAGGAQVEKIYANGGSGQFLVRHCRLAPLRAALDVLARTYREATGGEVRLAAGVAECQSAADYRQAVRLAHFQLRSRREMAGVCRAASLQPLMKECESASHLPAARAVSWGGEGRLFLSEASRGKREASHTARREGVWSEWMRAAGFPEPDWAALRCDRFEQVGAAPGRRGRAGEIGLVYADGNAMGRLVQELDSPETCRAFSETVDTSLREACFEALAQCLSPEIQRARQALSSGAKIVPLPADILLLGGDDLLVVLPADRALPFARAVCQEFERRTREAIAGLAGPVRQFFADRVAGRGLTISCGVALGRANYPFYLLLDLVEQLLHSAKRAGSGQQSGPYAAGALIDFHRVAGAASHELKHVRREDYQAETDRPRTLRPLSLAQLSALQEAVRTLRRSRFPRSKLHALFEAALAESPVQAERRVREVFSRCRDSDRQPERRALWEAVARLAPSGWHCEFPWFEPPPGSEEEQTRDRQDRRLTPIADLAEAYDLFPLQEEG